MNYRSLKNVRKGQEVSATQWNLLVGIVRDLAEAQADAKRGAGGSGGAGGRTTIAVPLSPADDSAYSERMVMAVVKAVNVTDADADGSALPSNITYDVVAVGRGAATLSTITPVYGRPVKGDQARIIPAKVDDLCIILRGSDSEGTPKARLCILTEKVKGLVLSVKTFKDGGLQASTSGSGTAASWTYTVKSPGGSVYGTAKSPAMAAYRKPKVQIDYAPDGSWGTATWDGSGNLLLLQVDETPQVEDPCA